MKVLVSAGAAPDKRNPVLETIPFHEAVRKRDPKLLKLLIRAVKNINIQVSRRRVEMSLVMFNVAGWVRQHCTSCCY